MRPFRYFPIFFILLGLFICCNRERNELRSFMETKIDLPGEMLKIESGRVIPANIEDQDNKPLLVILYGKEECVSCAVGRLPGYVEGLHKIKEGGRCNVVVIFSREENEVKEVLNGLKERKIEFPIYLTQMGFFMS